MDSFEQNTTKLKGLIGRTQKSGKQAWEAGKILKNIYIEKVFLTKYETFKEYTKKEFNIQEYTAHQYIKIYEEIPFEMITNNMLISHLYTIAEMRDDLKNQVLETMRCVEKASPMANKIPYDGDVILIFKQIVESAKNSLSNEVLKQIFDDILEEEIKKNKYKQRDRKNPLKDAISIERLAIHSSLQKQVLSIYSYAPISEQGVVGLFCAIFHLLKDFEITYKKRTWNFDKIIYVRTEFPDAKIKLKPILSQGNLLNISRCENDLKLDVEFQLDTFDELDIDIEFELDSFNYWRHKHHESSEKCDMIICWEVGRLFQGIDIPPILSIKEILETGKMTLCYSDSDSK